MSKQFKFFILTILLLLSLGISSCGFNKLNENDFAGIWVSETDTISVGSEQQCHLVIGILLLKYENNELLYYQYPENQEPSEEIVYQKLLKFNTKGKIIGVYKPNGELYDTYHIKDKSNIKKGTINYLLTNNRKDESLMISSIEVTITKQ